MKSRSKTNDAISRQAAIDAAERESQVDGAYGYMDTKSIVDMLNDLPSVQTERKKGKWNEERFKHLLTGEIRPVRVCSVCDAGWFRYDITDGVEDFTPKFCPNCGARMEGTDETD